MIYFQCDYAEGAHPNIIEALVKTNMTQTVGYGLDEYSEAAREKIRTACGTPDADVHFLVGGTQTNKTIIDAVLRPHQGVIAHSEGHVAVHETGAIEAIGHKVLTLNGPDGKLTAEQINDLCHDHFTSSIAEHTVQPGMVYISQPTESGTLYSKKELEAIYAVCRQYEIPLFIDGARLGYGLMSPECDMTLPELAATCDVFYIGGTKCGALFGEAVVITANHLKKDFRYYIKQNGGLLAKGRLLGIQFDVLFTDNLYFDICQSAITYAMQIREAFEAQGVAMAGNSKTNQQFPLLTSAQISYLKKSYVFEVWEPYDEAHILCRFCTSWATDGAHVAQLLQDIKGLPHQ